MLLLGLVVLGPSVAEAKVPREYAGIVVDAKTGKVLYSSSADALRYPASVSKVMTLYILFQELNAGRIKLSDKMPVSKWAAGASPTKLGLKAGSTITVENAIKAIVTLSANDMARVVAEYIAGSEGAFGKRMTSTARALGMSHTTYVNASGLPDSRQVTTVRDQARLGVAIYEHFPKYYAYFQTASFSYGRRTYGNHNNLLGHHGIDGIKTGYTGAAGYNLLTAARVDGKHIVVVGFGFASAGKRDAKVRDLVDSYLPQARSGDYLEAALIPVPGRKGPALPASDSDTAVASAPPIMPMPAPAFRILSDDEAPADPQIGIGDVDTVDTASLAPQPMALPVDLGMPPALNAATALSGAPKAAEIPSTAAAYAPAPGRGAPPAPLGQTRPSAPLVPPVGVGDEGQPIDLMTSGSIAADASATTQVAEIAPEQPMPPAATATPADLGWVVQIGASPTQMGATGLVLNAGHKVSALAPFQGYVERFDKNGETYFRARFGGFPGPDAANDMCKQLKQMKLSCLAMQG
ncbi:MAG: serine hydrolase [Devosia sp.]